MSATKDALHDYEHSLDLVWEALEDAIIRMAELNNTLYSEDGSIMMTAPRADVSLIKKKLKELQDQVACMTVAQEPVKQRPILPGEIRFDFDRNVCYVG